MGGRTVLAAAACTLVLTAVSLTAVALAQPDRVAAPAAGAPPAAMAGRAARCEPPATLPGQRVTAVAVDMPGMGGMMPATHTGHMALRSDPSSVSAGTVSLVLLDGGTRTHELVVLPLAAGRAAGERVPGADGTVDETGALGEASADCAAGTGQGVAPGGAGWVTLTLPRGRYELACNLPGHYAAGMVAELDVV